MRMKKKNKSHKKKINYISLIVSIIILVMVLLVNEATVVRPLLWILAIILWTVNILYLIKPRLIVIIGLFIGMLFGSIIIDSLISLTFKRIPVFAYNITKLGSVKVYNALGLRVWQCSEDDELIVDPFNNNGYMCNADDIEVIEANSFLNTVVANYAEYSNKYIKLKGKISKKTGQNYLEMRPYETKTVTVNGYVTFADNITLKALFKNNSSNLDNYDVYDEIIIVGKIKNLEIVDGKYIVYMDETKVVSNINLNSFSIAVTKANVCGPKKLLYSNSDKKIYSYCIEEMIITYPDNNYDIANALSSNKLQVEELYTNPLEILKNDVDDSSILKFNDYSVLICDDKVSNDVIIGSKIMNFNNVVCDTINEQS